MPTNRRRQKRAADELVTPVAVAAWKARDFSTVSRELRLKPWECDPAWCETFRKGGKPCSDEPHRGCQRGQDLRAELEERANANES